MDYLFRTIMLKNVLLNFPFNINRILVTNFYDILKGYNHLMQSYSTDYYFYKWKFYLKFDLVHYR